MPTKPWYQSLTIWSVAVVFLDGLSQRFFNVKLADQQPGLYAALVALATAVPPLIHAAIQVAGVIGVIIGRFRATTKLTATKVAPLPPGVTHALILLAAICSLALAGCASSSGALPSQFTGVTLSATDTKIVEGLESFDSPAALAGIETGAGTVTSLTMYLSIKQSSTMQTDGLLLYGGGQELEAWTAGSAGTPTAIDDIFSGLKENVSDTQSATNFAAIASSLDGLLSAAKTYVTNKASSATNPSVAAYAATVLSDDVHAAGKGVCDVTEQYAPSLTRLPPLKLNGTVRVETLCFNL